MRFRTPRLQLRILHIVSPEERNRAVVAVDTVGAGVGEMVVICQGSPARLVPDLNEAPVDTVVMGIVDVVDVLGQPVYSSKT